MMRERFLGAGGVIAAIAVIWSCGGDDAQVTPSPSDGPTATPAPIGAWADVGACYFDAPDSVVLAAEQLSQASTVAVIPRDRLDALSQEIDGVLEQIHGANPATEDIRARPRYALAAISVGLDPKLLGALTHANSVDVDTRYAQFDKLNSRLGLAGWRTSNLGGFALLCFREPINVQAATAAYREVDGVRSADIEGYISIPEAILNDIEAARDGDTWYVVLRESGTMFTDPVPVYFFTVSRDSVTEIPPSEAALIPIFERLTQACAKDPCELVEVPAATLTAGCPDDVYATARIDFAIDDAHRHVVLYLEPSIFPGRKGISSLWAGETDLYLELRDAHGITTRSIKLPPRGFVYRDPPTDRDPTDILNAQAVNVPLEPGSSYFAFRRDTGISEDLPIYLLKEGAEANVLHGSDDYRIEDIGLALGDRLQLDATCTSTN